MLNWIICLASKVYLEKSIFFNFMENTFCDSKNCFDDSIPPKFYSPHDLAFELQFNIFCNQVICCLEGTRIGIQYETSFAGNFEAILVIYLYNIMYVFMCLYLQYLGSC